MPEHAIQSEEDELEDEYDPDADEDEDEDEESEAKAEKVSRNFVDLPEGHLTLVGFSKHLGKPRSEGGRGVKVKSQVLYSTAKNVKSFPVKTHSDGRQMVTVKEALVWWDAKEQRKAERAAAATSTTEAEES
jgi:hypothetical protein